jgi:hypothetical protein
MNPAIRDRWVKALTSGDYKQGSGALRRGDEFCCLGVLCDLAVRDGVVSNLGPLGMSGSHFFGNTGLDSDSNELPQMVRDWAGLDSCDPTVARPSRERIELAALNDGGMPFAELAELITSGDVR